jgi:DNA-binding PadR family transcriptional regulator
MNNQEHINTSAYERVEKQIKEFMDSVPKPTELSEEQLIVLKNTQLHKPIIDSKYGLENSQHFRYLIEKNMIKGITYNRMNNVAKTISAYEITDKGENELKLREADDAILMLQVQLKKTTELSNKELEFLNYLFNYPLKFTQLSDLALGAENYSILVKLYNADYIIKSHGRGEYNIAAKGREVLTALNKPVLPSSEYMSLLLRLSAGHHISRSLHRTSLIALSELGLIEYTPVVIELTDKGIAHVNKLLDTPLDK